MVSKAHIYNALDSIRSIITDDLQPIFSDLSPEYAPAPSVTLVDWLTYIKSASFDPTRFSTDSQSFIDYVANANRFLALKNDSVAYARIKSSSVGLSYFFASPCVPLLPYREVLLPTFNLETMTGQVFIVSWKPYAAGTSPSLYWELRKRATSVSLKHIPYDSTAGIFNPVNALVTKEKLGNFYSGSNDYSYDGSCYIRVIDV